MVSLKEHQLLQMTASSDARAEQLQIANQRNEMSSVFKETVTYTLNCILKNSGYNTRNPLYVYDMRRNPTPRLAPD